MTKKKRTAKKKKKKIKHFVNKYNWDGMNFSSEKDDWKKIEKNNKTIAVNVLYPRKKKVYPADVWKHNSSHEKHVILLMISNREKREAKSEGQQWHYLAVKKLSALLIFIVWIVLSLLEQKTNLNCIKENVEIKILLM